MSYPFATKTIVEYLTEFPEDMTEKETFDKIYSPEDGPWNYPTPANFGKLVEGKDYEIVGWYYVKHSDLIMDYENLGRAGVSTKATHVGEIQELIAQGKWKPWRHQPVIVSIDGRLNAGFNRVDGHTNEDKEWIWACIVNFTTEEDFAAYAAWENDPKNTDPKWFAEPETKVVAAVKLFNKKPKDEITFKDVKKFLSKAGVTAKLEATTKDVLDKIGIKYEGLKAYTKAETNKMSKLSLGIDIYKSLNVIYSMFSGRKTTGITDREIRKIYEIAPLMIEGKDVTLISGGITDIDSTELKTERKYFKNIMIRFDKLAEAWVAAKKAGKLGKFTSYFPSQTKEEKEKGDFV